MRLIFKFAAFIVAALAATTATFAGGKAVAAAPGAAVGDSLAAIPRSLTPTVDTDIGEFNSSK